MFDWFKNLFKEKPKSRLGIDLGSSIIKIVEISPGREKLKLKTYGLASFSTEGFLSNAFSSFVNAGSLGKATVSFEEKSGEQQSEFLPASKSTIKDLSNREIAQIIRELSLNAKVETNIAYFAVPSFATFSTVINLPAMPAQEISAAIPYEAKKYIPVPLEDVVLDWVLIGEGTQTLLAKELNNKPVNGENMLLATNGPEEQKADSDKTKETKIEKSGLQNSGGEKEEAGKEKAEKSAEAVPQGLAPDSADKKQPLPGNSLAQTANQNKPGEERQVVKVFLVAILKEIIEKYTQIAQMAGLEIRVLEAESFCLARSLASGSQGAVMIIDIGDYFINLTLVEDGFIKVAHNAESVIDHSTKRINEERLLSEIEKVIRLHKAKARSDVSDSEGSSHLDSPIFEGKFIITGGKVSTYNLDYLKNHFKAEIILGSPFSQLEYPQVLEPILTELSPSLAVAIGMAMRQ